MARERVEKDITFFTSALEEYLKVQVCTGDMSILVLTYPLKKLSLFLDCTQPHTIGIKEPPGCPLIGMVEVHVLSNM